MTKIIIMLTVNKGEIVMIGGYVKLVISLMIVVMTLTGCGKPEYY